MIKKKNYFKLHYIIILSFIARIIAFFLYGDKALANEWSELVHNLHKTGVLGIYVIDGNTIKYAHADLNEAVIPSVFMPPLYAYFIYLIKIFFGEIFNLVKITIFFQIILSLISIKIFYQIVIKYFEKKLSFFIILVYAFLPINILATVQISSITLQVFLLVAYLFYISEFFKKKTNLNIFLISIFSALLLLTRGEFFIFYFFTLGFLLLKKILDFKKIFLSIITVLIIISPYLARNYINFDQFILVKSFGYNLLKGNNPESTVQGNENFIEENFNKKKLNIDINNKYEINLDNFYKKKAIEFIKQDPIKYFKLYVNKLLSFLFIDINSTFVNYYNLAHLIPKIVISTLSFFAAIYSLKNLKNLNFFNFLGLFYFGNSFLVSLFFILPRYSLMVLPIQLILILNLIFNCKKN